MPTADIQTRLIIARRFTDTVATTPAGLAKQLLVAFYTFGEVGGDDDWHCPALYEPESFHHIHGKRLLLSMLAGAERMAGVS